MVNTTVSIRPGWRSTVTVTSRDSIVLTLPSGATQLQQFTRHEVFGLAVGADSSVSIRLDSASVDGRQTPGAIGTEWRGRLRDVHDGGLKQVSGDTAGAAYGPTVARLLPNLPSGGVRTQTRWNDSTTSSMVLDAFTGSERRHSVWSAGPVSGNDGGILPVRVHESFEQYGKGEASGHPMTMTSQGSRSDTYYLRLDGTVDRAALTDSADMLISMRDSHQLIPTTRVATMTVIYRDGSDGAVASASPDSQRNRR